VESRTRFAMGGMSTVVASVAVVCAVALTNSVALADSAGVPIKAGPVVVPSPATSPDVAPALISEAPRRAAATVIPDAETVPGPAPIAVTTTAPSASASQPASAAALAAAEASGSWEPVRLWADGSGWPQARIDAWVERLEKKRAAEVDRVSNPPAEAAESSPSGEGDRLTASESPKTSAEADEHAERRSAQPDVGSKKDQSRDSPDRRD
jgi:hypothetical protein